MKRYGMVFKIKPEMKDEYIRIHKNVSAEILEALKEANISNNSVYVINDLLFMYLEYSGNDFFTDWKNYAKKEHVQKWFGKMRELLIPYENPMPPTVWTIMEEAFHMD